MVDRLRLSCLARIAVRKGKPMADAIKRNNVDGPQSSYGVQVALPLAISAAAAIAGYFLVDTTLSEPLGTNALILVIGGFVTFSVVFVAAHQTIFRVEAKSFLLRVKLDRAVREASALHVETASLHDSIERSGAFQDATDARDSELFKKVTQIEEELSAHNDEAAAVLLGELHELIAHPVDEVFEEGDDDPSPSSLNKDRQIG